MNVLRSGPALAAAFEAAYGRRDQIEAAIDPENPEFQFSITPAALIVAAGHHVLISEARNLEDAHVFVGGLTLHTFRDANGSRGELAARLPFVAGGTGYGDPPEWEVRTDLFATPALLVKSGGRFMGCAIENVTIFEPAVLATAPRTDSILLLFERQDQGRTSGQIKAETMDRSFVVHYRGAVTKTIRYRRSGDAYLPDASTSELPKC